MATRNQNILSLSRLSALLLFVVLVLVNAAFSRSSVRVDLTEEGIYTLADGSRRVLGSLRDPATIKVFWHDVPEIGAEQRRYLEALLDEMVAAGEGRLSVRWVDLEDEEGEQEATDAGIQKTPFRSEVNGELRLVKGYDSLLIEMGSSKPEVVHQIVGQGPGLEYAIVTRLHRMGGLVETVVGLVVPRPAYNPFGGPQQGGRFRALEMMLTEIHRDALRATLNLEEPIPPDVTVLVVAGPEDLSERAAYHLEQYLLGGGHVLLLLDPVRANALEAPNAQAVRSGLEDWLAHIGVTAESGVVGDFHSLTRRPRQVQTAFGSMTELVDYPYWPLLHGDWMDQTHPAVRGLSQVPLYWPAALSIDTEKQTRAGREVRILASTTESGYRRDDLSGLDTAERDLRRVAEADLEFGLPLIAVLDGMFTSFWAEAPRSADDLELPEDLPETSLPEVPEVPEVPEAPTVPEGPDAPDAPETPEVPEAPEAPDAPVAPEDGADVEGDGAEPPEDGPPAPVDAPADPLDADLEEAGPQHLPSGRGMLLVATDAEVVADVSVILVRQYGLPQVYMRGFPFVQNLIEWMGGSSDLLSLRAKTPKPRSIDAVDAEQVDVIKWLNIAGMPVLLLLAGAVVFIVRRYQQ